MEVTALHPCETEKIHCILIGAVVSVRKWGWICNSRENSVPTLWPINRVWDCLICCCVSFWLSLLVVFSHASYFEFGQACDVKVVWSQGLRHPPMWHKGKNEPLGSDTVGKHERESRERERGLWRGRMTESAACVRISQATSHKGLSRREVRLLGKCWDFLCMVCEMLIAVYPPREMAVRCGKK